MFLFLPPESGGLPGAMKSVSLCAGVSKNLRETTEKGKEAMVIIA